VKTDEELKGLYYQYLYRFALMGEKYNPDRDKINDRDIANQLLGAAFAYGRMLGFGMSRIRLDAKRSMAQIEDKELTRKLKELEYT